MSSKTRDLLKKNLSVNFVSGLSDVKEFSDAEQESDQDKIWQKLKNQIHFTDLGNDFSQVMKVVIRTMNQEAVLIMNKLFLKPLRAVFCQNKDATKDRIPEVDRVHSWLSSDPQGKMHARGAVIRRGLSTPLITKGQRRLRGFFEGDIPRQLEIESMNSIDFGPMFEGKADYSSILKCLSDTVN